jgi:hypothetical protein
MDLDKYAGIYANLKPFMSMSKDERMKRFKLATKLPRSSVISVENGTWRGHGFGHHFPGNYVQFIGNVGMLVSDLDEPHVILSQKKDLLPENIDTIEIPLTPDYET